MVLTKQQVGGAALSNPTMTTENKHERLLVQGLNLPQEVVARYLGRGAKAPERHLR